MNLNLHFFLSFLEWKLLYSLLTAVFVSFMTIPPVVRVLKDKSLVSRQRDAAGRKSYVPDIGGIAIFFALTISSTLFAKQGLEPEFQYILPAVIIIFFAGLAEDIIGIGVYYKLGAQALASLIIIVMADLRITSLYGILGIHELGVLFSIFFTLMVFLGIINAFNFIDGINGLASGLGIQVSLVFGFWLAFLGKIDFAILSFALTGALIPFNYFNLFGKKYKLFMGDTGSMIIGLAFAVLSVKIISTDASFESRLYFNSIPVVVASVMIIPLADSIKVILIRLARGVSPLQADKRHFHHHLRGLGFTHWQTSILIILLNTALFLLAFLLRNWGNLQLGLLIFVIAFGIMMGVRYRVQVTRYK